VSRRPDVVSSQKHADFACKFFEDVLRHTADDWWGERFLLCGWQEKALSEIFGTSTSMTIASSRWSTSRSRRKPARPSSPRAWRS